ncbi:MAG TPA: glycosyltransferase family protein [Opitutaceae bacterium]|jgi:uncharacterized protein (TIGR00661 family)
MNIVYGVSGEGLGHVFEAIEIGRALRADGHAIRMLTYGDRAVRSLAEFAPTRIEGVQLCMTQRGFSLPKTVRMNLGCVPYYLRNGRRLIRELSEFGPDVFITAYEPFTMIASHLLRRPLVSMDNQNELRHLRRPRGASPFAFHLANLATRFVTFGAEDYIVKSFGRRARPRPHVHVVSPVIQEEIRGLRPAAGQHVLVYLTKENPRLIELLKSLPETFVVYCHNREGKDANLTYRAQGAAYPADLAACKAIIATTGFSLIADSIFLKKPYFGVPLRGQFEQTYNAFFLRSSGIGDYSEMPTRDELGRFLGALPEFRRRLETVDSDPLDQARTLRGLLAGYRARAPSEGLPPEAEKDDPVAVDRGQE